MVSIDHDAFEQRRKCLDEKEDSAEERTEIHRTHGLAIVVPRQLVKTIKTRLESLRLLDRSGRIVPWNKNEEDQASERGGFLVLSTIQCQDEDECPLLKANKDKVLEKLQLTAWSDDLQLVYTNGIQEQGQVALYSKQLSAKRSKNPFANCIQQWIMILPPEIMQQADMKENDWRADLCALSYSLYPPMLLLSAQFWRICPSSMLSNIDNAEHLQILYETLCRNMKVSHIAVNAPIARENAHADELQQGKSSTSNILRSPSNLTPLHGDFGHLVHDRTPTSPDFDNAFRCTARQNGITQTWAPRYTMFSRGNITEKARILSLPSLHPSILNCSTEETTAVDLYAGIGYFAFSYAKAGVGRIMCWEINPWSVEGLMRGAVMNHWSICNINSTAATPETVNDRITVFSESNVHATHRLNDLRAQIPPVRHVNCGLLPTSEASWPVAVQCLDAQAGGWIHVHENVAKSEIAMRRVDLLRIFERLCTTQGFPRDIGQERAVACEHVEEVKSYAPGVIHCVFDISIYSING